jgi:uncharacterized membrane protein
LPATIVRDRINDVELLYTTIDVVKALAVLERYDVSYIYVGELERTYYPPEGLAKFDRMIELDLLEEVYDSGTVRIFEVTSQ